MDGSQELITGGAYMLKHLASFGLIYLYVYFLSFSVQIVRLSSSYDHFHLYMTCKH